MSENVVAMFIDPLAVMLLGVAASASYLAYAVAGLAKGKRNMANLAAPMFALGAFDFISGFYMSFFWPLPGAFNMLFGDPMLMLGLIMLAGAYALYENLDVRPVSILGFLLGIYLFVGSYGMVAYGHERGADLLPALGFFLLSAVSGIVSPVVYTNAKGGSKWAYYLLVILLVLVAVAAMFISAESLNGHLLSPP